MAVVQNTLIGKSKQSVGGTTFSSWKGINVLKSKPVSVANPKSDLQVMQRSALQQIVSIYRVISIAVKKGWKKFAVQKSEYNAFTSNALKFAFDFAAPPVAELDPKLLKITNGTLNSGNENFVAEIGSPSEINLTWDKPTVGNQSLTDELQVVVISADATRVKSMIIDKITRDESSVSLMVFPGETFVAGDVVLWGFAKSDYSDASVGTFVLATV